MAAVREAPLVEPLPVAEAGTAEHGGVWLSWRAFGGGDPVLLIMGLMGSGRAWFRLLPHLAGPDADPQRLAITFDNRGTGDSDRPSGLWTMDDLVGDAVAVMDAAGVERAHVIGASMGGMIAQHLALDHPDRVRSLSLVCTHPGRQPGAPPWRMMASLALRPALGPGRTFGIAAPMLYSERTRTERRARMGEDLRLRFQEATPSATARGQIAAILRHDTRARLGELQMPVLVLHGEEDRLIPPSGGRELADRIPGARLVLIPKCGHVMMTDAEEEVAAAMLDFLDECS